MISVRCLSKQGVNNHISTCIKLLRKIASADDVDDNIPGILFSFDLVHVFKALQLMEDKGQASRALLSKELALGEGVIRTLLKHLRTQGLVEATKRGTKMTQKGKALSLKLFSVIVAETSMPQSSVALGKFNYAVLLKQLGCAIKSGIEQRDAAIKMGGVGATTLLFKDDIFVMPGADHDSMVKEAHISELLIEKLKPQNGDVILIGSASDNQRTAELAAKKAALLTIMSHDKQH